MSYEITVGFRSDTLFKRVDEAGNPIPFGITQEIGTLNPRFEWDDVRTLGDRRLVEVVRRTFRVDFEARGILGFHDILKALWDQQTDPTTGAVTGYAYAEIPPELDVYVLYGTTGATAKWYQIVGGVVSELSLEGEAGEPIEYSVRVLGRDFTAMASPPTGGTPSTVGVYSAAANASSVTVGIGANSFTGVIRSFEISVSTNAELIYTFGDAKAKTFVPRAHEVEISIGALFTPDAFYDAYLTGDMTVDASANIVMQTLEGNQQITFTAVGPAKVTQVSGGIRPVEPVEVDMTLVVRDLTISVA